MRRVQFIFCLFIIVVTYAAIIFLCLYLHSVLPAAAGAAGAYALSLFTAIALFCGDMRIDYKCAWLAVIAALPVIGAVLYVFSRTGGDKAKADPPVTAGCTDYEYFKDGAPYLARITECIPKAKSKVYLEFYIISKGHIWGEIFKQLVDALGRNVSVMIIYDGLGSALHAPKKQLKRLKKLGAEIKVFNKLRPFPVTRLNSRNHRKIAVIDGAKVFLGGVNIADEYANLKSPHGYWKDGGIMLCGDVAKVYEEIFLTDFYGENHMPRKPEQCFKPHSLPLLAVTDAPASKQGFCEELLTSKIYSARERVLIMTPYLCTGEKIRDALVSAARRGVDVKIIIPHTPDKRVAYELSLSFAEELTRRGITVYRYTPGFMHAKCVVCDDEALLGSYNFDYRSMSINYECGIWAGGNIAKDAIADFRECAAVSAVYRQGKVLLPRRVLRAFLQLLAPLV